MNLREFEKWALAQGSVANPEPDFGFKGECVSLIQQYLYQVCGIKFKARGNAKDWANNIIEGWDKFDVSNTLKAGDYVTYPSPNKNLECRVLYDSSSGYGVQLITSDTVTDSYTLGADDDMPIESKLISKAVENAQKKVEGRNFSIRKNVLKYDDVMNAQREIIYKQRRQVLDGENINQNILNMIKSLAEEVVMQQFAGENEVNIESLNTSIKNIFGLDISDFVKENSKDQNAIVEKLQETALAEYAKKEEEVGSAQLRELERIVMLKVVDQKWMDHIDAMDELKDGIGLRAYGQQDPVVKYRIEGMDMFDEMILDIKHDVVQLLMNLRKNEEVKREEAAKITGVALQNLKNLDADQSKVQTQVNKTVVNQGPKVGRNDPCPCGSGKKYKNCCGKNA